MCYLRLITSEQHSVEFKCRWRVTDQLLSYIKRKCGYSVQNKGLQIPSLHSGNTLSQFYKGKSVLQNGIGRISSQYNCVARYVAEIYGYDSNKSIFKKENNYHRQGAHFTSYSVAPCSDTITFPRLPRLEFSKLRSSSFNTFLRDRNDENLRGNILSRSV